MIYTLCCIGLAIFTFAQFIGSGARKAVAASMIAWSVMSFLPAIGDGCIEVFPLTGHGLEAVCATGLVGVMLLFGTFWGISGVVWIYIIGPLAVKLIFGPYDDGYIDYVQGAVMVPCVAAFGMFCLGQLGVKIPGCPCSCHG